MTTPAVVLEIQALTLRERLRERIRVLTRGRVLVGLGVVAVLPAAGIYGVGEPTLLPFALALGLGVVSLVVTCALVGAAVVRPRTRRLELAAGGVRETRDDGRVISRGWDWIAGAEIDPPRETLRLRVRPDAMRSFTLETGGLGTVVVRRDRVGPGDFEALLVLLDRAGRRIVPQR